MKLFVGLILTLGLAASPALAQGTFGAKPKQTWSPGGTIGAPSSTPKTTPYDAPSTATAPQSRVQGQQRIYSPPAAPAAEGFKAYKPFSGGSTYANPYGGNKAKGAKDCERSVYANACDH